MEQKEIIGNLLGILVIAGIFLVPMTYVLQLFILAFGIGVGWKLYHI